MLYLVTQSCPALCDPMDCSPPGSSVHRDSPGKNTGVCCHALLQGIFQSRDQTQVFCTADGFFIVWATREGGGSGWLPVGSPLVKVAGCTRGMRTVIGAVSRDPCWWAAYAPRNVGASSQLWDGTRVSCIAGKFFTIWVTRKPSPTDTRTSKQACCDTSLWSLGSFSVHQKEHKRKEKSVMLD